MNFVEIVNVGIKKFTYFHGIFQNPLKNCEENFRNIQKVSFTLKNF